MFSPPEQVCLPVEVFWAFLAQTEFLHLGLVNWGNLRCLTKVANQLRSPPPQKIIYTYILFGFLNIIYQRGINKIVGIFMLFFAYVNILSLRNKGKKQFKLALLKINICLMYTLPWYQKVLNFLRGNYSCAYFQKVSHLGIFSASLKYQKKIKIQKQRPRRFDWLVNFKENFIILVPFQKLL